MYAAPSVLKRYASATPAPDEPDFCSAAVLSCTVGVVERTKIAPLQIKSAQAKITLTARFCVEPMKIFFPAPARCLNIAYHPFGRIENCPGCPSHRQPLLCALSCEFRRALTCAAPMFTLADQPMSIFPYGTLAEIDQEIRSKHVSPVQALELHLTPIDTLPPKPTPFAHF